MLKGAELNAYRPNTFILDNSGAWLASSLFFLLDLRAQSVSPRSTGVPKRVARKDLPFSYNNNNNLADTNFSFPKDRSLEIRITPGDSPWRGPQLEAAVPNSTSEALGKRISKLDGLTQSQHLCSEKRANRCEALYSIRRCSHLREKSSLLLSFLYLVLAFHYSMKEL